MMSCISAPHCDWTDVGTKPNDAQTDDAYILREGRLAVLAELKRSTRLLDSKRAAQMW